MDRDGVVDLPGGGEDGADGHLGNLAQTPQERLIFGCGHRDRQNPLDDVKPQRVGLLRDLVGDLFHRLLGHDRGKGIDVGEAEAVRPLLAGFILAQQTRIDDALQQLRSVGPMTVNQFLQLVLEAEGGDFADELGKPPIS